jgi:deoxyribonuclease-4
MRIGIHTSISGGFEKAIMRLVHLECNACQIFSRSPRGGKARVISNEEAKKFRDLCIEHDINPVAVHIPYVLNLATPDPEMHDYAVYMVREDMKRANLLGAKYLVLHMGSHRSEGIDKGLAQVVKALNSALQDYDGSAMLLLENTSGSGKEVGNTFEQLVWTLDGLKADRVGICFDTCHAFAAGYNLSDEDSVNNTISELDKIIGVKHLKLIHANDAMFPVSSLKDRHAQIGKGYIGIEGFKAILNHSKMKDLPVILELPCETENEWVENIKKIKELSDS